MIDNLGELGKSIENHIEQSVEKVLAKLVEPVTLLKKYESVEVLTLDEACEVLRSNKERIREACKRGELPHTPLGRDIIFPKRLLAEYLMGSWRPAKKERAKKLQVVGSSALQEKVRNFVG